MFSSASRGGAIIVALAAAAVLAACGSDSSTTETTGASSSTTKASTVDEQVAALVPAAVKSKGTLTVAADASYPPNEFIGSDGKTVEGMDADLAKALTGVMGLKAKVVNATFDAIIPGLAAEKYDLGMSSFTDTKEREKTVDFVTYLIGRHVLLRQGAGRPDDQHARRPLRPQGRRREGHDAGRRTPPRRPRSAGAGQARRDRVGLPRPERREPGALERSRRRRDGRLARRRDYQVKQSNGQFKLSRARPTGRRRTGSRSPRTAAWPSRCSPRSRR